MTTRIRTRFAPSPTGFIHLGNIRSALYPWAFARSQGGDFILRIEDTDVERSSQAAVDVILEGMKWLGLDPDEGPFYQMQRMDRYKEVLGKMKADGLVYPCYMSIATNLGDTKSIITHPATTSHGRLTEQQRQAAGIGQGLVRLAVGLEYIDDIKADLQRGLDTLA